MARPREGKEGLALRAGEKTSDAMGQRERNSDELTYRSPSSQSVTAERFKTGPPGADCSMKKPKVAV